MGSEEGRRDSTRWGRRDLVAVCVPPGFTFAAALAIHARWFPRLSGDGDEGVYLHQARVLMTGHLTESAAVIGRFFQPWLSGTHAGHVFSQYLPGWAVMLGLAEVVFGTPVVAPALAAAGWVLATYWLTLELFGSRRSAAVAGIVLAVSPVALIHGALLLSYAWSAAALTAGGAAALRGRRTARPGWLVVAGALWGWAAFGRPYDVILFATPVVAYLVYRQRRERGSIVATVGTIAIGAAPFVLLILAYNTAVTGRPFLFPLQATDHLNTFGFGARRILPTKTAIDYSPRRAYRAMVKNVRAVPYWIAGGWFTVALAAVALVRRGRVAERLLLVGVVVAFPLGYLMWWATTLSAGGARHGVGPHYYVPVFGALAALASDTIAELLERHRATGAVVLAGVITTAVPLFREKLPAQRYVNALHDTVIRALPKHWPGPVAVILRDPGNSPYVGDPYQYLTNTPNVRGKVAYAAPIGPGEHRLHDEVPDRALYRLDTDELRRGEGLFGRRGVTVELSTTSGARLRADVRFTNPTTSPAVVAYAGSQRRILDQASVPGKSYEVSWTLAAPDAARPGDIVVASDEFVTIGFATADTPDSDTAEQWEQRVSTGPRGRSTEIEAQWPGYEWRRTQFPGSLLWVDAQTDPTLAVSFQASL